MEQLVTYVKESYNELVNKVTWPSWASLQSSTILVIVASLIMALIIFGMDVASSSALDLIYPSGN
jgi:preprotein translocase subunit SecE